MSLVQTCQLERLYNRLDSCLASGQSQALTRDKSDKSIKNLDSNSHFTPKHTEIGSPEQEESLEQIEQVFLELKSALNKTCSCRMASELFQIQELLIKLSNRLLSCLNEIISDEVKSAIYSCLKKVAKRPELSLQSIGYDKEYFLMT